MKLLFSDYVTLYFSKYLPGQLGVSANTIKSYRDSFTLLLRYCRDERKIRPEKLTFQHFSRKMVIEFLDWLEETRHSGIATRNQRLAAIHAFFRYVMSETPDYLNVAADILKITAKKAPGKAIEYLTIGELACLFRQPSVQTPQGKRDLALLSLLYDSGARVQELVDLKFGDVRLDAPATVQLTGKGSKSRIVPITPDVADILRDYIRYQTGIRPSRELFLNNLGRKFSRSGVEYIIQKYADTAQNECPTLASKKITPHVFRHSKAMHLVEAGVNIIYIRDFLGHTSVQTTEIYAKADNLARRKALEKAGENIVPQSRYTSKQKDSLLDWLKACV